MRNYFVVCVDDKYCRFVQPFSSQFSLLISLTTSENQSFSDIFRGNKWEHWEENGEVCETFHGHKALKRLILFEIIVKTYLSHKT